MNKETIFYTTPLGKIAGNTAHDATNQVALIGSQIYLLRRTTLKKETLQILDRIDTSLKKLTEIHDTMYNGLKEYHNTHE